ncbi:MAG: hypothetical protein ISQ34_05245 [Rickettsiales bacterium]|nr:hypothetical protein [Rickettsiales bacterium]
MTQLELFVNQKEKYLAADFIETDEISIVLRLVKSFLADNEFATKQIPNLIIKGEKSSGKTHLVHFLQENYGVKIVDLEGDKVDLVNLFEKGYFYVLEDVDKIENDELLLNIINLAKENEAFLIFTLTNEIKTKIKDLISRLRNFFIACEIKAPSDDSMKQLLIGYFARNQMKISSKELNTIISNSGGRYDYLFNSL